MRFVQLAIPVDLGEPVREILEDGDVEYLVTAEDGGDEYDEIVTFVVPTAAVEGILDELRSVGVADRGQTVIVDAETVISESFDSSADSETSDDGSFEQIARQELQTRAIELLPSLSVFAALTVISAVVATAGLLLNSPAVVVGSMVIAPLIGPALSASVGTVVNDLSLFRRGVRDQNLGILLTVASAAIFAALVQYAALVPPGTDVLAIPEVVERTEPGLLALFIALGAGIAGALSITRQLSTALVGVMIAAALIPPAAAAGVAIAWGDPVAAIGAGVLTLVNLVSINLMGLLTLWYVGYRPAGLFQLSLAKRQLLFQVLLYAIAVLILSTFLLASTATAVQHATVEQSVDDAVDDIVGMPQYDTVVAMDVEVVFADRIAFGDLEQVIVTVGHSSDQRSPTLSADIQIAILERTGTNAAVQVRYIRIEEEPRG